MALTKVNGSLFKDDTISGISSLETSILEERATIDAVSFDKKRKNRIINGKFDSWQHGTSLPSNHGTDCPLYLADMFHKDSSFEQNATTARSTDTPTKTQAGVIIDYSMEFTCNNNNTSTTTGFRFATAIEGKYMKDMDFGSSTKGTRYATLSFWVKSSVTGSYGVGFSNEQISSSSTGRHYVTEYTISSADTWEKKTITIPIDTSGTWEKGINAGIHITWTIARKPDDSQDASSTNSWYTLSGLEKPQTSSQANVMSTVGNKFYITAIQFESGSSATDFEVIPVMENLRRCRRYFELYPWYIGTNEPFWYTLKRDTPSITISGTGKASSGGQSSNFTLTRHGGVTTVSNTATTPYKTKIYSLLFDTNISNTTTF